jgi:hypothetical protein
MTFTGNRIPRTAGRDRLPFGIRALQGAGAPTVNVTGLGIATVGSLYVNTTTGVWYSCTATDGATTVTWAVIGAQTGP